MYKMILHVQGTDKQFVFDIFWGTILTIGRKDIETGEAPDVDLHDVGAFEKGVSLRHASIIHTGGEFRIADNDTSNGTYLNGEKLGSRGMRLLRDGDDIRLGHLVLHVTFQRDAGDNPVSTPYPAAPPGGAGRAAAASVQQTDWDDDTR